MTFGRSPNDRTNPTALGTTPAGPDSPYGQLADGFGGHGPAPDGFGGAPRAPVQLDLATDRAGGDASRAHDIADAATAGGGHDLPHLDTIQRAFGPHDVSAIRAHTDDAAARGSAQLGAHAFASGNDVAFASPAPDLHTAAHEAAHVVQQRAGVQLKDGLGQVGDTHERHADAVADAVVRGESAAELLGPVSSNPVASVQRRAIQRFSADEHRAMGDAGAKGTMVRLADDYLMTYGQVTALAGDHFESLEQMRAFAKRPTGGAETREEIEYAREWKLGEKARDWTPAAQAAQERRYYALAQKNDMHFPNALAGDSRRSTAEKSQELDPWNKSEWWPRGKPLNAIAAYRTDHVKAINEALAAGRAGHPIDRAMAADAYASHFLTDTFAAGHVRTERTAIRVYWDGRVPMFAHNFVGYLAEKVAKALNDDAAYGVLSQDMLVSGVPYAADGSLAVVRAKINKKGSLSFGDIVALALHDSENRRGVRVSSGGSPARLLGDGYAQGAGDQMALASRAVEASIADVKQAHALGASGAAGADELLGGDGLFAAERLIPVPVSDQKSGGSPEIDWRQGSLEELLEIEAFRSAVADFCEAKASEMQLIANEMGGAKKDALERAVITPMKDRSRCMRILQEILDWTPDTGGGAIGQNTDDNALAYEQVAARTPGGLQSLSATARANLIADLMKGAMVADDEETAIWQLLDTAPMADARIVIKVIGWEAIDGELEGRQGKAFRTKFPREEHRE